MTHKKVMCSGKSHPNASKSRAKENCTNFTLVEDGISGNFKYLCRGCSPVAPPPPNTFAGKQFDRDVSRVGKAVKSRSRDAGRVITKSPSLNDPEDFGCGLKQD